MKRNNATFKIVRAYSIERQQAMELDALTAETHVPASHYVRQALRLYLPTVRHGKASK